MTEQTMDRSSLDDDFDELAPIETDDVIEVPLLLSGRQMLALEEAAHDRGLTAGEMVRQLLQQFIAQRRPSYRIEPI